MFLKRCLLLLCLLFCTFDLQAQLMSGTFQHNGVTRSYLLYLPANIAPNAPLVMAIHGRTSNPTEHMNRTNWNAIADNFGFAVCYPMGSTSFAGVTHWNSGFPLLGNADDLGFLTDLIPHLQQSYQLNPDETFATGFSNGGYMSYHLACNETDLLRAIAPVGGTMSEGTYTTCNPSGAIPIFHIHGELDNLVPVAGYPDYNDGWGAAWSVDQNVNYWNGFNNCGAGIRDTFDMPSGTQIDREKFENCDNPIWKYIVLGEGHSWPNSSTAQTDFPTTEEIWCFFSQFTNQVLVENNFEGGNGKLLEIGANNYVKIMAEFESGDTRNITYYCKILNLDASQPLQLEVETEFVGDYTFYSYDSVNWLRSNPISGNTYTIPLQSSEIYVAHFPPYLYSRISAYLDSLDSEQLDHYQISNLTMSEAGNPVKYVRITDPCIADTDKKLLWVLGRMHAFEHPANYVTEGMLRFFVSDEEQAKRLRREAIIYIVPMMDVDSAIEGATGKDQNPVDFNRDWIAPSHNSHWNATVAAKNLVAATTAQNELSMFFDVHSVSPTGPSNFHFIYNDPDQVIRGLNFIDRTNANGGYAYDDFIFGGLNTATSQDYVLQYHNSPSLVSLTPETTFHFAATGVLWTIDKLIGQGKDFGRASSDYINGTSFPNEIVVDNLNAFSTSSTGVWTSSTFVDGYYGNDYVFVAANNNATFDFNVNFIPEGVYEVSLFNSSDLNRASNVQATLTHPNGSRTYTIDQTQLGGQWRLIDTISLGNNASITFSLDAKNTDGFVVADALRLRKSVANESGDGLCDTVEVNLKAYLEGAMAYSGLNEMRTDLNTQSLLPLTHPYTIAPYNFSTPTTVASHLPDVVDWVLVEARSGTPSLSGNPQTQLVETQVGVLTKDGNIVHPSGSGGLKFSRLLNGEKYWFLLRHRNHLDVLTAQDLRINYQQTTYDFTSSASQALGTAQLKASSSASYFMLHSGDYDQDGLIQTSDYNTWKVNPSILNIYDKSDGNLDGTVQTTDYDRWYLNKAKLGIGEVRY